VNAQGDKVTRKPDAGNLHVRFDEGEGNPSLLYPAIAPAIAQISLPEKTSASVEDS